jgi:hypothetical protein
MAYQRTNAQIAETLATLTNLMAREDHPRRNNELTLEKFMKHKPPTFNGGYDPDGAQKWLEGVERIFDANRK